MWMPSWIVSLALLAAAGPGGGEVQRMVFVAKGGDAVVPSDEFDRPPSPLQTDLEWPSDDLYRRGQGGTVVLRLVIDDQGVPARVSIEKSSGVDLLDMSAATAATQWRFAPAADKGRPVASEARQPVTFEIPPEYSLARTTGRERDAWFEQRRSGKAAVAVAGADGRLPGFIQDELPIGVDSVDQANAMLERYASRLDNSGATPGRAYILRDEEGYSEWWVMPPMPDGMALVVRNRLVGDADSSWMVQNLLCEGDPVRCADLRGRLAQGAPMQSAGGPYPVPPVARRP